MYEMKGPRLVLRGPSPAGCPAAAVPRLTWSCEARHQLVAQPLPYRAWPGPAGPSPAGCPATAVPRL